MSFTLFVASDREGGRAKPRPGESNMRKIRTRSVQLTPTSLRSSTLSAVNRKEVREKISRTVIMNLFQDSAGQLASMMYT